jgi:hypothetical protein
MSEENAPIVLGSVRITAEEIAEMSDGVPAVRVPRADITRIVLKRAVAAERPIVQMLLGLAMMTPGIFFFRTVWSWWSYGGTLHLTDLLWFVFLFPLGLWLVLAAARKRFPFHVETRNDRRKVVFKGKHTPEAVKSVADEACHRFNYPVELLIGD